jgi:hypothetical protein
VAAQVTPRTPEGAGPTSATRSRARRTAATTNRGCSRAIPCVALGSTKCTELVAIPQRLFCSNIHFAFIIRNWGGLPFGRNF